MQIESVKVYCDLVETESFTKAAQINNVTQSAVSQTISTMERLFKSRLIERSKKQFRLTREGQVFYDYGRQILQTHGALLGKLQEIKNIISGNIRVATVYSIGLHDLPPYVKKFLKSYPTVNVHVEFRRSNEVYEDVLSNTVDLGLVAFPRKVSDLEFIPLQSHPMVLICHPQHPWAKKKSVKIKDLAGQSFVSFEADMPTRKAIDKVFRDHRITVQHGMEFDNVETVKQAVEIGAGMAIVPRSTIIEEVATQRVAELRIEGAEMDRPWGVLHRKNKVLSPAMRQFITVLKGKATD
jgi:LysR family transcriptional regulator, transcriptional activator of the cysJI operon